ncbi:phosphopantetheine-binding protein [Aliidiomarina halalkaliphila]|nr:phosphopantetheine-binding protein [Aliidiomarina halalkaliphila]
MTIREHQLEQVIRDVMDEVAAETGREILNQMDSQTLLVESGLDSLGLAIVMARLEERLGYDPFSRMSDDQFPHTFSELVAVYRRQM